MIRPLYRYIALAACAGALASYVASSTPASTAIHKVPPGADLQDVLDAAQPGDEILLAPGATYMGTFTLPRKGSDQFIVIRTDAPPEMLPGPGARTSPAYAPVLAKIKSAGTAGAITAEAGAHHWRFENLEFEANPAGIGDIVVLGGSQSQTAASQMPHHIVLDRIYIHGDPTYGQKRGVALNAGDTEIVNSYISDIKSRGQDAQAIAGWNGAGPYLIENNYLEASGENILFGGADPSIRDLVPSDIVIRRNVVAKPLAWRNEGWLVKNSLELKNARRVVIEGNVFENVWLSGQVGFAILFTPANQDGRAPWSVVEDVAFRNNVVRHAGGGVNMTGVDHVSGSGRTQRIQIANNLFYDIGSPWGGAGIFLQMGLSPRDVVVERNTILHSGNIVTVYGKQNGEPWRVDGFVFRENVARHNDYGVIGEGLAPGLGTLTRYFQRLIFERNVIAGGDPVVYPLDNYFPSVSDFDALFAKPSAEDFTIVPASPFARAAQDGGALGVDVSRLTAAIGGTLATTPSQGDADKPAGPCGPAFRCEAVRPPSRK
jgi:hypothetical protein